MKPSRTGLSKGAGLHPSNPESLQCPPPCSSETVLCTPLAPVHAAEPPTISIHSAPTPSLCCGSRVAVEGPSWIHG